MDPSASQSRAIFLIWRKLAETKDSPWIRHGMLTSENPFQRPAQKPKSVILRFAAMHIAHQSECDEHEDKAEDEERRIAEEIDRPV